MTGSLFRLSDHSISCVRHLLRLTFERLNNWLMPPRDWAGDGRVHNSAEITAIASTVEHLEGSVVWRTVSIWSQARLECLLVTSVLWQRLTFLHIDQRKRFGEMAKHLT